MSEIGAIKNAIRAEKYLGKAAKASKTVTATGRAVDLSRGFNVKGPDGVIIPFRAGTDIEKAKVWTKNFYRKDFDTVIAKKPEPKEGVPKGWEGNEHWSVIRDKKDPGNMMQFSVLDDGSFQIHTARIGEAYRGQGIGAGMYRTLFEKAKKQGAKVTSDSRLSKDSFAVWQRFKALGYPIKEKPWVKRGDHYELKDKDLMKTPEEQGGIFEFDPLAADVPNLLKTQAGQVPGDTTETTGMLVKPQAGEARPSNLSKVEPGLYFDEDSSSYVRVGDDGSINKVELDEAS